MNALKKVFALLFLCFSVSTGFAAQEFTLEKDDVIRLVVFQEDDLSTETVIGKDGTVSFPLIGNVQLIGKTLKAAEEEIEALYEKDYLRNAQVTLAVVKHAEKWVIVGGDVRSPGTINYPEAGALDLRGAIAQAGGPTDTANTSDIIVRRKSGDIQRYSLESSGGIILGHGDSVTVGKESVNRSSFTVSGSVNRPGLVEYPKVGSIDIVTAIAQAGGFSRLAHKNEVQVRRGKQIITVDLRNIQKGKVKMFYVQPGDSIYVRESRI